MKLCKTKGIVIKETNYSDNDKILTILTEKFGKISCMAKGARKTNSSLLAPSQFLVYSEFVLYKGSNFYHINSAEVINTFYNLKTDYDKLEDACFFSKILFTLTYENEENDGVLSLFLNTLYILENKEFNVKLLKAIFKLKLLTQLGLAPNIFWCRKCGQALVNKDTKEFIGCHFSYSTNNVSCDKCNVSSEGVLGQIKISKPCFMAIGYVILSDVKKIFSFKLEQAAQREFTNFVETYYTSQISSII